VHRLNFVLDEMPVYFPPVHGPNGYELNGHDADHKWPVSIRTFSPGTRLLEGGFTSIWFKLHLNLPGDFNTVKFILNSK
jgi:hypothetical protein